MSDLLDLSKRAQEIKAKYDQLNKTRFGGEWNNQELMLGFMGDVGDLAKLVAANEGRRDIPDARAKLEHELADCLWSVLVLAKKYDIDIEEAFMNTMKQLDKRFEEGTA